MKKRILITGSAGFIGHHLVQALSLAPEVELLGLDNINDYYEVELKYARLNEQGFLKEDLSDKTVVQSLAHSNSRFLELDLLDGERILEVVNWFAPHQVVHLAAQPGIGYSLKAPLAYLQNNDEGTLNLLEACRKIVPEHFLFASSSSVYGLNRSVPFREDQHTDHPISMYAATKKGMEMLVHTYSHLFGIPSTGLRFFTVYGPWGRPDMAFFIFTKRILEGRPITLFNHGDMRRDFTYVDDIIEGVKAVLALPPSTNPDFDHSIPRPDQSSAPFRILNIGNNGPVDLQELVKALERSLGKKADVRYEGMQPGDVKETYADVTALKELTGYHPGTPIEEGVSSFVKWYKEHYQIMVR